MSYFTEDEIRGLHVELVEKLEKARKIAGVPFVITSGKRTKGDNATVGGAQDSAHVQGRAVDLRSRSSSSHYRILLGAYQAGFNRIGVYHNKEGKPSHIHLDDSPSLPQEVVWLGESK